MQQKVKLPAVALLVLGILGILACILGIFMGGMNADLLKQMNVPPEQADKILALGKSLGIVGNIVGLLGSAFIVYAALQMMKLQSWGLAIAASILVMIPCFTSCCCVIGIAVGIWALVVLMDKEVRAAFQQPSAPPM